MAAGQYDKAVLNKGARRFFKRRQRHPRDYTMKNHPGRLLKVTVASCGRLDQDQMKQ